MRYRYKVEGEFPQSSSQFSSANHSQFDSNEAVFIMNPISASSEDDSYYRYRDESTAMDYHNLPGEDPTKEPTKGNRFNKIVTSLKIGFKVKPGDY